MDIKELVKTITREEFLNNKELVTTKGCPKYYGLECTRKACSKVTCKECWRKAVENIKFKGEDEMKKFNWEDRENTVVHCDTEEKAIEFLRECDKRGIGFRREANTDIYRWEKYKENTCYYLKEGTPVYQTESFYRNRGYKIFEWELESVKESEPKELFTFQEVIANIKEDEKYTSEDDMRCLKEITLHHGLISLNGKFNDKEKLNIDSSARFYKEEQTHEYIIHKVRHTPEGIINSYRNPEIEKSMGLNVVCHTPKGKIYGRRVSREIVKITEKEWLTYPIIENINE